jgi:hypothetical protein
VIRNFNADGFALLYPKYRGGRPPKFIFAQRREVKKIAMARPGEARVEACTPSPIARSHQAPTIRKWSSASAYELGEDNLYGHIKPRKTRARFLEFCRYLRSLYPPSTRIAIICDNFSPHLTTANDKRSGPGRKRTTPRSPTRRPIRPG